MKLTAIIIGNDGVTKYHRLQDNEGLAHMIKITPNKEEGYPAIHEQVSPSQAIVLEQQYIRLLYKAAAEYAKLKYYEDIGDIATFHHKRKGNVIKLQIYNAYIAGYMMAHTQSINIPTIDLTNKD